MEEINIKSEGINLSEEMRKHLVNQMHAMFGFSMNKIKKVFIRIMEDEGSQNKTPITCSIKVYIEGHPTISTKLTTLDIQSAISLAIERANLKISRRLSDERINKQRAMHHSHSKFTNSLRY